jgi:hypothetical protein
VGSSVAGREKNTHKARSRNKQEARARQVEMEGEAVGFPSGVTEATEGEGAALERKGLEGSGSRRWLRALLQFSRDEAGASQGGGCGDGQMWLAQA